MAMNDEPIEQEIIQEDGVTAEANPPCMALVPLTEKARWSHPIHPLPRPDSNFVTQLIATLEQAPQTRTLRRATASDARAAYTANRHSTAAAGLKARQIV
jgi:hypothetical protein